MKFISFGTPMIIMLIKCWLVLKVCTSSEANIFDGTGVNVCIYSVGRKYLGSAIGTPNFVDNFNLC